jgi:hypothetical protein
MSTKQVAFPDRSFPKTAWPQLTWPLGPLVLIPYLEEIEFQVRMNKAISRQVTLNGMVMLEVGLNKQINLIVYQELKDTTK